MNAIDDGRKIEYCCPQCLASIYALDTAKPPRCARCMVKMLPNSDEPRPKAPPPQAVVGRTRGRPTHQAQAKLGAA